MNLDGFPYKGVIYQPHEERPHNNTPYTLYTWELSLCGKYVIIYKELEQVKWVVTENEFFVMTKSGDWKDKQRMKRFLKGKYPQSN